MTTVTISPKFQVMIPKVIREALKLKSAQKVEIFAVDGRIEIVPVRPVCELRGFVRGIITDVGREGGRG